MKHLLSSSAFLVVNKILAKQIGLNSAVLLADLISKESYFIENGMIQEGWFFNTQANISRDTTLTPYQQRNALLRLKDCGIVECEVRGIPAKTYYKISEAQVIKFLNNKSETNLTTINKNKEIKIINKYFNKPHVFDIKNYCLERKNNIDPEAFYDFYESKGWMVGRSKMKCWKSAVRNWERGDKKKPKTMSKLDSQINEYLKGKEYL